MAKKQEQAEPTPAPAPAPAEPAPAVDSRPSYIIELEELAALVKAGVISPEQFEAKKAQLLGLDPPAAT